MDSFQFDDAGSGVLTVFMWCPAWSASDLPDLCTLFSFWAYLVFVWHRLWSPRSFSHLRIAELPHGALSDIADISTGSTQLH